MEDMSQPIDIVKSRDPNKLIVFHASSLKDEIRFFINTTYYITAIEQDDGTVLLGVGKEIEEKNNKSTLNIIRKNFKEFFVVLGVAILVLVGFIGVFLAISSFIRSSMALVILLNIIFLIFNITIIVMVNLKFTPRALKSKHSAEHMMANFLEKNKRMPKDIEELKKSSRFCMDCGSRDMIDKMTDEFMARIVATTISIIASSLWFNFFENQIVYLVIFIGVYILVKTSVRMLLKKKLGFITIPLKDALTILVQCANTTKKVEDKDLELACCVADAWMEVVYPEFCNHEAEV